ncbi:hypothetical protein LY78DRAFT_441679 [Colletotrichum sublineola]|nr:hypothetical protein LY78DRAFT_441679 [Colletotrichum sublineola]
MPLSIRPLTPDPRPTACHRLPVTEQGRGRSTLITTTYYERISSHPHSEKVSEGSNASDKASSRQLGNLWISLQPCFPALHSCASPTTLIPEPLARSARSLLQDASLLLVKLRLAEPASRIYTFASRSVLTSRRGPNVMGPPQKKKKNLQNADWKPKYRLST